MKNITLFLAAAMILLASCSKDVIKEEEAASNIIARSGDITNIDGTLHFASPDAVFAKLNELSKDMMNVKQMESELGFTSLSSYIDTALDDIYAAQSETELQEALNFYSDLVIKDDDGNIVPVIDARSFTDIANKNGVFYVGDIQHQLTKDGVRIMTEATKGQSPKYETFPIIDDTNTTKAEESKNYYSNTYSTPGSGKVVRYIITAKSNVLRLVVYGYEVGTLSMYHSYFTVQLHLNHCKYDLGPFGTGFWGTQFCPGKFTVEKYAFLHTYDQVGPQATYGGACIGMTRGSGNSFVDWYLNWPAEQPIHGSSAADWPIFSFLRYKVSSNFTSSCGVILEVGRPDPFFNCMGIPPCK